MTREKIISLAGECDPKYIDSYGVALVGVAAVEAFYHAAQAEAFEAAARLCDELATHGVSRKDYMERAFAEDCADAIREMAKEMK